MGWVKLDDNIFSNSKVMGVSERARLAYIASLALCAAHLTDGFISPISAQLAANQAGFTYKIYAIRELVAAGLWEQLDEGFMVHDYLVYNPSKEQVLADRKRDRERKSRWRAQGWDKSRRDSQRDSPRDGRRDSRSDATPDNSNSSGRSHGWSHGSREVFPTEIPLRGGTAGPSDRRPPSGPVPADDDQRGEQPEPDFESGKAHLAELRQQVADPPRGLRKSSTTTPEPPREPPEPDHSEEPF